MLLETLSNPKSVITQRYGPKEPLEINKPSINKKYFWTFQVLQNVLMFGSLSLSFIFKLVSRDDSLIFRTSIEAEDRG